MPLEPTDRIGDDAGAPRPTTRAVGRSPSSSAAGGLVASRRGARGRRSHRDDGDPATPDVVIGHATPGRRRSGRRGRAATRATTSTIVDRRARGRPDETWWTVRATRRRPTSCHRRRAYVGRAPPPRWPAYLDDASARARRRRTGPRRWGPAETGGGEVVDVLGPIADDLGRSRPLLGRDPTSIGGRRLVGDRATTDQITHARARRRRHRHDSSDRRRRSTGRRGSCSTPTGSACPTGEIGCAYAGDTAGGPARCDRPRPTCAQGPSALTSVGHRALCDIEGPARASTSP